MTYNDVNNLAIKYTENNVVKIPTPSVTENPFMGADPIKNYIFAVIKVVIFASITAVFDFS